jgi:hypothetical protein
MIGRVGVDHYHFDVAVGIVLVSEIAQKTVQGFFFIMRDSTQ